MVACLRSRFLAMSRSSEASRLSMSERVDAIAFCSSLVVGNLNL